MYYTAADGEYGGETGGADDPRYHNGGCGAPKSPSDLGGDMHIFQSPQLLMLTYMSSQPWMRKIWIGQEHPEDLTEYVSFWMGHSVGRWEGDTLVVDTAMIKEGTMLSVRSAIPQSGNLHMIERFSLDNDGNLHIEKTYDDPVTFTEPWSESRTVRKQMDWEGMQFNWEIEENHAVCEPTGGFWAEFDPWFDNFDSFAGDIIPDVAALDEGPPPLPEGPVPAHYLGAFGEPR